MTCDGGGDGVAARVSGSAGGGEVAVEAEVAAAQGDRHMEEEEVAAPRDYMAEEGMALVVEGESSKDSRESFSYATFRE